MPVLEPWSMFAPGLNMTRMLVNESPIASVGREVDDAQADGRGLGDGGDVGGDLAGAVDGRAGGLHHADVRAARGLGNGAAALDHVDHGRIVDDVRVGVRSDSAAGPHLRKAGLLRRWVGVGAADEDAGGACRELRSRGSQGRDLFASAASDDADDVAGEDRRRVVGRDPIEVGRARERTVANKLHRLEAEGGRSGCHCCFSC